MTMIPLTDTSRRPARYPAMTTAIILMNVLVFVLEIMGGDQIIMIRGETEARPEPEPEQ